MRHLKVRFRMLEPSVIVVLITDGLPTTVEKDAGVYY